MFQLLIVDDEESVVEGLIATIPCDQLQIDKIYFAFSAQEALGIVREVRIDLLISDIKMPEMSGLQLLKRLNEDSSSTKKILLTGYDDFEFAQQALKQGASDYLLKPVDDDELIDSISKVLIDIKQEWETIVAQENSIKSLAENLPVLRSELLNNLLRGQRYSPEAMANKLETLRIPFTIHDQIAVIILRINEFPEHYDDSSLILMKYAIQNIFEEVVRDQLHIWSGEDTHDYLVFVVKSVQDTELHRNDIDSACDQLHANIRKYLHIAVSIAISEWGPLHTSLSVFYRDMLSAFRKNVGHTEGMLYLMNKEKEQSGIGIIHHMYAPPYFTDLLEAGRWDELIDKLNLIFNQLETQFPNSIEHMLEVYYGITSALTYIAHKSGYQVFELALEDEEKFMEFNSFRSLRHLREWTMKMIGSFRFKLERESTHNHSRIVKKIQSLVEERISEDISLQAIADFVHLHPVYISQVFRSITGESLSSYILRVRMEKSIYLLKNSNYKIYEIATQIGYNQAQYFIKVFKKYYGVTPQQYRDSTS